MSLNASKCKIGQGRTYYVDNGDERVTLGVTEEEI